MVLTSQILTIFLPIYMQTGSPIDCPSTLLWKTQTILTATTLFRYMYNNNIIIDLVTKVNTSTACSFQNCIRVISCNSIINYFHSSITPCSAKWVKVSGTKYQTPMALIIDKRNEELVFGKVINIYADAKTVFFEFIHMSTKHFSHHYHAFVLSLPPLSVRRKYLIKHHDLLDYHPYGLYTSPHLSSDLTLEYVITKSNL